MALIKSTAIPSAATDYDIGQSLRFEDGSSDYLSWTPASAGNRKTFTFSCWVKRGNLDTEQVLFSAGTSGSNVGQLRWNGSGNTIKFLNYTGSFTWNLTTTPVYRDSSSWYNIIAVADTTNGTSGDRVRLYVNGQRVTVFDAETYPTQNLDGVINNTTSHNIGRYTGTGSSFLDGYLSEVNFIDGQALTPADFGETGDYGEWKPIEYSGSYGTNGFYLNFAGGGIMSATGGTITTDGDYKVHSFTSGGTFTPTSIENDGYIEYLVIAGAGGGGGNVGGGGGAGGFRTGYLSLTKQAYTVTVGAGGYGGGVNGGGGAGSDSVFSSITSIGGGGGGGYGSNAGNGGSGGGAGSGSIGTGTSGQGNNGGTGYYSGGSNLAGGGGGGAGAVGANGSSGAGGNGGNGLASSITGSSVTYAGGGGGRGSSSQGSGGSGGGGAGAASGTGTAGTANTGSGGGVGSTGGAGGSGIVIIRYKFQ